MNGTIDAGETEHGAAEVEITSKRIDEMIRWHGTDESALPPAHTLQHLARDTVAALRELARDRETIACLRAAMARAFWATDRRAINAILLEALGPPPTELQGAGVNGKATGIESAEDVEPTEKGEPAEGAEPGAVSARSSPRDSGAPTRLDAEVGRGLHHSGAARSLSSRAS